MEDGLFVSCIFNTFIHLQYTSWLFSHGKSPFLIGIPSVNGSFPMAMLNNQRVNLLAFIPALSNFMGL